MYREQLGDSIAPSTLRALLRLRELRLLAPAYSQWLVICVLDGMFIGAGSCNPHVYSRRHTETPLSTPSDSSMDMDMYAMPSTGFEGSLYAEAPYNMDQNSASPGLYTDDGELRMPSSSLSTASASSSAIGSPQSNPGRLGQQQEWNAQYQPSIVGNDYISPEYTGYPIEEQQMAYDFSNAKGFVGKFACSCSFPRLSIRIPSPSLLICVGFLRVEAMRVGTGGTCTSEHPEKRRYRATGTGSMKYVVN